MGLGLHQALWDLLCRLSDPDPHFEAQRILVHRFGRRVRSNAQRRGSVTSHSPAAGFAILLITHATCSSQQAAAQPSRPWMDASLPPDPRADMVVEQLTLDEKIQLVHGIGWGPLIPASPIPPDNNCGAGEVDCISRLGMPSGP